MDLIGHCAVALDSGLHDEAEIFGPGLPEMMMPNILHCHDWAYATMWDVALLPAPLRTSALRIRSHIVADWVIHYGGSTTRTKRKCGWAYRRMGAVHRERHAFFARADALGLLGSRAVMPDQWTKKQRLDFAHSIAEYALDFRLSMRTTTLDAFASIKRSLAALDASAPGDARRRLRRLFAALGGWSDRDAAALERSIDAMAHDAATAQCPEDFAILTTIRKYGFADTPAARRYVGGFLDRIAVDLDRTDIDAMLRDVSAAVRDPASIYDGPLLDTPRV